MDNDILPTVTESENDPPTCARCDDECSLDDFDYEPTKYCHGCAHIRVAKLEKALAESEARLKAEYERTAHLDAEIADGLPARAMRWSFDGMRARVHKEGGWVKASEYDALWDRANGLACKVKQLKAEIKNDEQFENSVLAANRELRKEEGNG